jgi:hypothetical protein
MRVAELKQLSAMDPGLSSMQTHSVRRISDVMELASVFCFL